MGPNVPSCTGSWRPTCKEGLFVHDVCCGADPDHRLPVRIITQYAWHSLFARNLFIQPPTGDLAALVPEFAIIDSPGFHALSRSRRHE